MGRRFAIIPASIFAGAIFLPATSPPRPVTPAPMPAGMFPAQPGAPRLAPEHVSGTRRALENSIHRLRRRARSPENRESRNVLGSLEEFRRLLNAYSGPDLEKAILRHFNFLETRNARGDAHLTGYYDPLMIVRARRDTYFNTPVYERPRDLIDVNPALFAFNPGTAISERLRGRLKGNRLVPYFSRREIMLASAFPARRLFYANDVDLHFFQLQGGGMTRDARGRLIRLGYAADNGHPHRSLYPRLKGKCDYTRAGIKRFLMNRPELRRGIMNENPRFVFFRKVRGRARGDMGAPLTAGHSVAMDPRLFPRGALVYLRFAETADGAPQGRFAFVQDSGSAIRGHGRADLYFGSGAEAESRAWRFNTRGRIFVLVPRRSAPGKTGPGEPNSGEPNSAEPNRTRALLR